MGKVMNINRMKGSPSRKTKTLGDLKVPEARMNSYCTVAEAMQISLAAAEDMVRAYTGEMNKLVIQQTLFIDGLKRVLVEKGLLDDDIFSEILKQVASEYQKERDAYIDKVVNKTAEQVEPELENKEEDPKVEVDGYSDISEVEVSEDETENI